MTVVDATPVHEIPEALSTTRFRQEARRVLKGLSEPDALLAVAVDMDKAVVLRETEAGSTRKAVVDRSIAEAMALKSWISCATPGRISRYRITGAGRVALEQLQSEVEAEDAGQTDKEAAFLGADTGETVQSRTRRKRYGAIETPLVLLARRRGADGERFLSQGLVRAGERLHEDFEMAQVTLSPEAEWEDVLTAFDETKDAALARATRSARRSVRRALEELGPGLSDVSLRCCCFLEGLETAEKKMGWSARSGKIVLRIALQRLKRHYDALGDEASMMG